MCGITGFYLQGKDFNKCQLIENLTSMTKKLDHRGPDDSGIWLDSSNKIGFGQTRLSIRDLSKNGSQPMFSSCKRYVIIYNGEIYDTENTKTSLTKQNVILKSNTDTEILIESISRFGLIEAIKKTNGMFAFALWDIQNQNLTLARDRFGEKPLYYGWTNNQFVFGEWSCIVLNMNDSFLSINQPMSTSRNTNLCTASKNKGAVNNIIAMIR